MALRTFGSIRFDEPNNQWVVDKCEPHVCIRLKHTFPQIPKTSIVPFFIKNKPDANADLYWFLQRYALSISFDDMARISQFNQDFWNEQSKKEEILRPDVPVEAPKLVPGEYPRDYQVRGFRYFEHCKRLLCGDDIGLGKTLIGILPLTKPECWPALFVVQAHLTGQWQEQIKRFLGVDAHIIKKRTLYDLPQSSAYITSYSKLQGWVDYFSGYIKYVCFDEVQELRKSDSHKYTSAKNISADAEYCLGLSATPIYNYGDEIYSVQNIIKPGSLGDFADFRREWCAGWSKQVDDPQALGSYLRENHLMLRRTRSEVGKELPAVNKIVYEVDYDESAADEIEEVAKMLAMKVIGGSFTERGQAARELDLMIRMQTGVAKAKHVAAFVRMLLEAGDTVVLSGWHRDVYKIWGESLADFKPVFYTGSESASAKQKSKDAFLNGETNLFIISNRSGIGLDGLQKRCNTIVIGELDWSPKVHEQITGRLDRDGQPLQVTCFIPVCNFGSDPLIVELLALKQTQSHNIMNPDSALETIHSDESRIKALAEYWLKSRGIAFTATNISEDQKN